MTKIQVKDMNMIEGHTIECNGNVCFCGERIFFTEEMLQNNIIIVDTSREMEIEEGIVTNQTIEILYANDLYSQQILLYHGPNLKDMFDSLLKKEIATQFTVNTIQNFMLNMVALSESNMTSVDLFDYYEAIEVKEIITSKINTIKQYLTN
ncbi:hypothetical protein JOD29_002034 [Lysinibacillus composti]|uniref:Uncharacterized protein n=1 Tax=Lysinibacillus composti TaxID=720633 RepID=A0A3N9UEP1_9BACI|nr:hypothetical protein [Lysinibacillus composti]MBM7608787.1 hypothetical protein [Lysinibacillus composti]RQW74690.1 hypothetical protein EBB45_10710 [Lysinibacillus composti]